MDSGSKGFRKQYSILPSLLVSLHVQVWSFWFFSLQTVPSGHTSQVGLGAFTGFKKQYSDRVSPSMSLHVQVCPLAFCSPHKAPSGHTLHLSIPPLPRALRFSSDIWLSALSTNAFI